MQQEFYINHGSVLPTLRMEIIHDGRNDFDKFWEVVQDADIFFSMESTETGILKVSKQPAELVKIKSGGCEERYAIQYKWKERDTKIPGIYKGWFDIKFRGEISQYNVDYPEGNLIMPIGEELIIYVQ